MPSTCLLCYEQSAIFLMPPCNHKQMCWKCCLKLIEGSTFSCPFCKGTPTGKSCILFVSDNLMEKLSFEQIFKRGGVLRSSAKSYQYYSDEKVAKFIQQQTSFFCRLCFEVFQNLNLLKKHLHLQHSKQFCDVCVDNRKCLISEQILFTEGELIAHQKKGQFSEDGELVLYHPYCEFCKTRYYDIDALRVHLRLSSHLRCHICEKNYPHLRYIYYKDIDEIQKHFKKSHFMCDKGICIERKLQNVFVSESALEDHVNRIHNKVKGKNADMMNVLLFQNPKEDQAIQWDRIGKDFTKQFGRSEKNYQLAHEEHTDRPIDIREFYPQKMRHDNRLTTKEITKRLQQYFYTQQFKSQEVMLSIVPIFGPLSPDCSNIPKYEIQRLIKQIYDPKVGDQIIITFFEKKHQFKSPKQYFLDIQRKMTKYSKLSYYYVFPQLIRFLRDQNPTKKAMDQFYSQSLRELAINKEFVFHNRENYSDLFVLLQEQIQGFIYEELFEERINIDIYIQYLKQMNPNFYIEHNNEMFYVPKEKMVNLYHMIDKCKTKQLPRMNWLLKIGFSPDSLKIMMKQFFYKTSSDCNGYLRILCLHELAMLYAYSGICIEALQDKQRFKFGKQYSTPMFLSHILPRIPVVIENKQKIYIEQLQRKSLEMNIIRNVSKNQGIIINQSDHPSILTTFEKKKEEEFPTLKIRANITHTNKLKTKGRKDRSSNIEETNEEEYPSLVPYKKEEVIQQTEQEFPVFNFRQNFINKKSRGQFKAHEKQEKKTKNQLRYQDDEKDSKTLINEMGLFSKEFKSTFPNQNRSSKGIEVDMPTIQQVNTLPSNKNKRQQVIAQPKRYKKKGEEEKKQTKNIDEDSSSEEDKKQTNLLIKRLRLDWDDSDDEKKKEAKRKQFEQSKRKLEEEEQKKKKMLNPDGFESLLKPESESIVNKLIKDSNKAENKEPQRKIKKGKKGKAVLIEKVDLSAL